MLKKITSDTFLKRYAVYFSGSMVVAFLNYAFHPVLGRFLSPVDFGEIQAMIALVAQSAIIFGAFSVVAINVTANIESNEKRNAILFELQKISLWVVALAIVFLLFSLHTVQTFFNFTSSYVLVALAVMWPVSALVTFRNAYLQGSGNFTHLTTAQLVSAGSRLVLSVGLVALGFGLFGAVLGIVGANILFLIFLVYHTYKHFPFQMRSSLHELEQGSVTKELRYGVLVFFATALVTVYYTSDVLIVKRFFTPEEAGLYSGISAIAKILYFAIGPVSAVLVSSIKIRNSFAENSASLMKSLVVALGVGGIGLCTFSQLHDIVVRLMLGNAYLPFSHFLPKVSLVMFLAALANIFILYFLALRRFFLIAVSVAGFVSMGLLVLSLHTKIDTILNDLIISLVLILLLLFIVYVKDYFNHRSSLQ